MNTVFKSTEKAKLPSKYTGRPPKYPFGDLKVNESFRLPYKDLPYKSLYGKSKHFQVSSLRSAASHYGKRHNKRFSVTKHDDFYEVARVE